MKIRQIQKLIIGNSWTENNHTTHPAGLRREKEGKDMYNVNNIRTLKKVVREMNQGEKLYINAIGLTVNAIEQLREYIKENVLLPEKTEAQQLYNDLSAVMSGKTILPQMTYIKQWFHPVPAG